MAGQGLVAGRDGKVTEYTTPSFKSLAPAALPCTAMASPPSYALLLHAITLGTARRELPPPVTAWLDMLEATDPEADAAEHLLAALALTERTERVAHRVGEGTEIVGEPAPEETLTPPSPRLARGLQLILEGTYPDLLDEAVGLVGTRGTYVPPALLPALLERAVKIADDDFPRAQRRVAAGGQRGAWLLRQHPDWAFLGAEFNYAQVWKSERQPARRASLLSRWRRSDPEGARTALEEEWESLSPRNQEVLLSALETNLSAADQPWLRRALEPKRKGVRQALGRLLLRSGEEAAIRDFTQLARKGLSENNKDILATYGGVKAPQTLRQLLLTSLPPWEWTEIASATLPAFWQGLKPLELRDAGQAVRNYAEPAVTAAFVRMLVWDNPPQFPAPLAVELVQLLTAEEFNAIYHELLDKEQQALSLRSIARLLALSRNTPWSERLSKAMVNQLTDNLRSRQLDYATQRDLALHWKLAIPLVHVDTFPWLRQQLHATTERYDAFGKLATEMLQTTSFRQELRKA